MKIIYLFLSLLLVSCQASDNKIPSSFEIGNDKVLPIFILDSLPPPKPPNPGCGGTVLIEPEKYPYFPGCEDVEDKNKRKKCSDKKIINFIHNNLKYPKEAFEKDIIEGTVVIRFIVEKDGSLIFDDDLEKVILRDIGGGCGKEALRVLKLMPKWNPGTIHGKPIRMQFTMPVRFRYPEHKLKKADNKIYKLVESMPRFPGCEDFETNRERKKCSDMKIISFFNKNVKYPPLAKEGGIEGKIVIRFIVEKDGSISFNEDKKKVILRGGDILGEAALKVFKSMPKWTPGKQEGKVVRVEFTFPMTIHLAE